MFQSIHSRHCVSIVPKLNASAYLCTEFSRNFAFAKAWKSEERKTEYEKPDVLPSLLQKRINDKEIKVNLMEQMKTYPFVKTFLFEDAKTDTIKQKWPFLKDYATQCSKTLQMSPRQFRYVRQKYELTDFFDDSPVVEGNGFLSKIQSEIRDPATKETIVRVLTDKQIDVAARFYKEAKVKSILLQRESEISFAPIKKKWREWITYGFMSLGHPLIFELREMFMAKPGTPLSNDYLAILSKYLNVYKTANFIGSSPTDDTPKESKFLLSKFLILKSRLQLTCDWDDLHQNQSEKLGTNASISPLAAYKFADIDQFTEECTRHFERCLQFQQCWQQSEPKLRSNYTEATNTKPEAQEAEDPKDKKDLFINFLKFFQNKMKDPSEVLFPYLWKRVVVDRNIESDEFTDRIWNRWRLDNDENYPNRGLILLLLMEPSDNKKAAMLKLRVLSGEEVTDSLNRELMQALQK